MTGEKISKQKSRALATAAGRTNPTKAEHRVLGFISEFISQHGYGPSYREIMRGCGYSTLSVVSLHVDALIKLGLLTKKERGARSLSLTKSAEGSGVASKEVKSASPKTYERWLMELVEAKFKEVEASPDQDGLDELYVLTGAMKILGYDAAVVALRSRLKEIEEILAKLKT
jgi:hypothetical protein